MESNMASDIAEKTEQELRKEIDELNRKCREITERLHYPRGLRRGGARAAGRNFGSRGGGRQRGLIRPAERNDAEDQPMRKKRLSSTVVKIEDGEIVEDASEAPKEMNKDINIEESSGKAVAALQDDSKPGNWSRRDVNQRPLKGSDIPIPEPSPRVLPKDEDPKLVSRNKRMLGQLLGTLERFREEDAQRSGSEAYMRRSDSLKRAEQKAREESERLRQQEREKLAEKRKEYLTLRARLAVKVEEKGLELLLYKWSKNQERLGNFLRTEAQPPIYYKFARKLDEDPALAEKKKEEFEKWETARKEELAQYQKQVNKEIALNVKKELERWQNGRRGRRGNDNAANLQETMDQELEMHRLEHGEKTRKIPGSDDVEDEIDDEEIEDIVGDRGYHDYMDDEDGDDESAKPEVASDNPQPENQAQ